MKTLSSKKITTTPNEKFYIIPNDPGKIVSYMVLSGIIILCVYLIMTYVSLRLKYKPLFDWWNQNGGKEYNKLFNVMTLVSSKNSALLYYIENYIFTAPLARATNSGLIFILTQLIPLSTYVDSDGTFQGVITPRCLCESVLPKYGGHDIDFNTAIDTNKISRGGLFNVDHTATGLSYTALTF